MELLISKLWIVWATVGLILLIVEMLTPTLFFAGMGIGAFLASVAAYYGANLYWQIIIFAVFSIIFTVYIKPIFKNSLAMPAAPSLRPRPPFLPLRPAPRPPSRLPRPSRRPYCIKNPAWCVTCLFLTHISLYGTLHSASGSQASRLPFAAGSWKR